MIHAASMLAGLAAVWLILSPSPERPALAAGVAAILAASLVSWRLGVADREAAPYLGLLRRAALALRHAPATLRESLRGAGAVFARALKPALVRMRTRDASETARASVACALSANPGTLVVETSADAFLLHVIDEDSFDPGEAIVVEASVIAAVDGRQ